MDPDIALQSFLKTTDITTDLCHLMNRYGSDKGNGHHNYTIFYDYLFRDWRQQPLTLFELGLGTNNTSILSNMGAEGKPGASLYGWRDYFPHAQVYGADIDREILFGADRIQTYHCDQTDPKSISQLWETVPVPLFDVVVEDGLHTFLGHYTFLTHSFQKVKDGGFYIVEDLMPDSVAQFQELLPLLKEQLKASYLKIITLANPRNQVDNNLLVIRK